MALPIKLIKFTFFESFEMIMKPKIHFKVLEQQFAAKKDTS